MAELEQTYDLTICVFGGEGEELKVTYGELPSEPTKQEIESLVNGAWLAFGGFFSGAPILGWSHRVDARELRAMVVTTVGADEEVGV